MQVIGDIARLNAKRYPDRKALIMGDEHVTYGQLNDQANQLAHRLVSMGIEPGDKVAILSYNCPHYVVISYAVAKCGAVVVPVNFRYKRDELVYVINNCEPKVLFFGPDFISLVKEAETGFASPVHLVAISGEPLDSGLSLSTAMREQSSSEPTVKVDPAAAFAITYTSGTTGFPKGVLASHSAFLNTYVGMIVEGDLGPGETTLVCLPLFHNGGMHSQLQPTLVRGGTAVIMPRGFQPEKILDAVERHGVTMTMWVPTQLAMLVNDPGVTKHNLSTLRKIWYGSSPISPTLLKACMDTFKAGFYQWYGQTETGMVAVLRSEDHLERSQCTGREMFNANLRVVDEEGQDVSVGEVGEIISSQIPLGMMGYHNMEEANSRTIRDGWIHTGDLARMEGEGYFTVVDRLTNMIISGGENIYPKEIEDVISSHPGVQEVAVFGIPDEIYGESVCAVVVKREGYDMDEEDIISLCGSRISSYKKPKRVEFTNALPKNPTGKVTKNVLRERYWTGEGRRI
jgi:fatty-acyl-CoA synthase